MKHDKTLQMQNNVLRYLNHLPRKMLNIHGCDNMTEFVLHELCDERCFNFSKVAYLIDNPDFNCLKGVAGVSREDCSPDRYDIWEKSEHFSDRMKNAPFNQKVRSMSRCSLKMGPHDDNVIANEIAAELGLNDHGYCAWELKHGNHGLLIFEKAPNHCEISEEHLLNGASLLSFCPVF